MKKNIRLCMALVSFCLVSTKINAQALPDPGGDPIHAVDSVKQTSNMKSLNSNPKEARNVSSSKSSLRQLGKTLPNATTDSHENKQEQTLKSPAATTLAGYYR